MAGGSVETTLELWASALRDVKGRMRPLFSQDRVAASASQFLDGLLSNEPRKTGWMRAEAAGDYSATIWVRTRVASPTDVPERPSCCLT